jgi:hypothetical protein
MPPSANEAFMPSSIILLRMYFTAASDAPPDPVWIENPFLK